MTHANASLGSSTPLVPPLYQSSVYTIPDLDELERIYGGESPGFIYARDAHPNARRLATQLARVEAAEWAIVTSSGMAALSAIFLATLGQGGRVVASNRLYGRTTDLLAKELPRFGVTTTFVDTNDLAACARVLETPASVVLVETMSNPLLRMADLPALATLAHDRGALLVVDNTFATPALCRPLELGADLVMESLTKMMGGHSDVTLGALCGKGERLAEFQSVSSIWGLSSPPFDCWLAERGLGTLGLRMKAASDNALGLANWLAEQPGVARVVYPGRPEHADHALATKLLTGGFGNMMCFDLAGGRDAVNRFMHQAPGVPFSPSLGHVTTTCSHPASTSQRYLSPAEKHRQGITDGLVRLSVGVEPLTEIQAEFRRGLACP